MILFIHLHGTCFVCSFVCSLLLLFYEPDNSHRHFMDHLTPVNPPIFYLILKMCQCVSVFPLMLHFFMVRLIIILYVRSLFVYAFSRFNIVLYLI